MTAYESETHATLLWLKADGSLLTPSPRQAPILEHGKEAVSHQPLVVSQCEAPLTTND
jgi:hypothetical protein